MKKALVTILQYVIFLGLGIWIVYHMLHELSPAQKDDLVNAIKSINAWYLIPIFIAGFLSHFFRTLRWRLLLESIGLHPSVMNTTFAVMIGYITNLALPRAGEVAKCTVLAKYEKLPAHKMVGTIVAERAFDIVCLLVIALSAFVLQYTQITDSVVGGKIHHMRGYLHRHENTMFITLAVLVALIIFTVLFYRKHRDNKIGRFMAEMGHGISSIIHMKKRWQFMIYTVLMWMMYLAQLYIGLKSLHDTNHLTLLASLVVLVYGSVGMIVTPGGIGLYTLLVAQVLNAVYSINEVPAEAFGWIAWLVPTVLIIVLGVLSLLLIHPYNERRNAKIAVDTK